MKISTLIKTIGHRSTTIPNTHWRFYQEWNNAVFLHWQVELDELRKFVPNEIEIDLFEGKPWISIVVFTMEKVRPRFIPPFPPVSNFEEINIRTYVKYKGKTGVYFLSIEGGKIISCKLAKGISELPYRYSKITRNKNSFSSKNKQYSDHLKFDYNLGDETKNKTILDSWLMERYALFQETNDCINAFYIHHVEWPIQEIKVNNLSVKHSKFSALIKGNPDIVKYSKGVEVLAWSKEKTER